MRDWFEIGPAPCNEECAQVGENNFVSNANKEMDAYINQLNRKFGELISGTTIHFRKKWYDHDFGRYGEVIISYDDAEEKAHLVYEIERELPEFWDEEALKELSRNGDK